MEQIKKSIFNSLDEHGVLLDLPRIPGEKNKDYKARLLDVGVNRASSAYSGLLNGITRELGMSYYDVIEIGFSATPLDTSYIPTMVVDHTSLIIYEDYLTELIELEVELFDKNITGAAHTIDDVAIAINTTTHFTATILDATKSSDDALTLIHQDSNIEVPGESIPASNRFFIKNTNLIQGTISFSEIDVFFNEVTSPNPVLMTPGDYYIDSATGEVVCKSVPSGLGAVSYRYVDMPFKLKASPVIIKDVNDDKFKTRLFDQVINHNGDSFNGLPNSVNVDIIKEVLGIRGLYWGS